jgi:hypothetical protein
VIVRDNNGLEKNYISNRNELEINNIKGASIQWGVATEVSKDTYSNIINFNQVDLFFMGSIDFIRMPNRNTYKVSSPDINIEWKSQLGEKFQVKIVDLRNNTIVSSSILINGKISIPTNNIGHFKLEISSLDYPTLKKAEYTYYISVPMLVWSPNNQLEIHSPLKTYIFELKYTKNLNLGLNLDLQMRFRPLRGDLVEHISQWDGSSRVQLNGFGKYCFTVRAANQESEFTDSDEYCVNFIESRAFKELPKAKDSFLKLVKIDGIKKYKAIFPNIKNAVKYYFEVYSDLETKSLVFSSYSPSEELLWETNRSGIYYIKYKVFDNNNSSSDFSPLSKIIFPISPFSDWKVEK